MMQADGRRLRITGSLAAILLLCAAVVASAAIYDLFFLNSTATIRAPDVTLAAGSDSSSCPVGVYPCATVAISGTSDTATVSLTLFKADAATYSPPPSTYYTNLIKVDDANNPHSILSVSVASIASSSPSDFGSVTVYYCTTQCTFNSLGAVSGGTQVGILTFTSSSGTGPLAGTWPQGISVSGVHYIEVVAYAGSGANAGTDTISFSVAVQWV